MPPTRQPRRDQAASGSRPLHRPLQKLEHRGDDALRRVGARAAGAAGAAAGSLTRLGLAAAAGWAAYAWGAHLLTPGCLWRGSDAGRRAALALAEAPEP